MRVVREAGWSRARQFDAYSLETKFEGIIALKVSVRIATRLGSTLSQACMHKLTASSPLHGVYQLKFTFPLGISSLSYFLRTGITFILIYKDTASQLISSQAKWDSAS
jgi:hypothetical protein